MAEPEQRSVLERYRAHDDNGKPTVFEMRGDIWLRVVAISKSMDDAEMIASSLNARGAVSEAYVRGYRAHAAETLRAPSIEPPTSRGGSDAA